jgi:chorismate dehydratase
MSQLRLGAVSYLNARPLVYGLEQVSRFALRYDIPSECARLLHAGQIDLGLIPSIEYLRGETPYAIVPGCAVASRGAVASVAIFTTKPMRDVRSIALDTSSRTSAALVSVLCTRLFKIQPALHPHAPDLQAMLAQSDAALVIGDRALLIDEEDDVRSTKYEIEKIDLGLAWLDMTGLPFVYALWAGRPGPVTAADVEALQQARDAGAASPEAIARAFFPDSAAHQAIGARYLRDNIKYYLGAEEAAGLEAFYRYAAEAGVVARADALRLF